jgi:hypothetical protein
MMHAQPRIACRGFSLLEAIVSIAIAVALLGALAVFTTNLGSARERLAHLADRIDCADAVFHLCDQSFATAVVDDAVFGAGISGNESSLRIVHSGIGTGGDDGSLLGDREVHGVAFDASTRRITITRSASSDTLSTAVRACRVRYLTSTGWVDAFDSGESGAFPVGVEVSLWFDRMDAPVESIESETDSTDAALLGRADRTRFFRVMGAPRVDALARRAILDEETP